MGDMPRVLTVFAYDFGQFEEQGFDVVLRDGGNNHDILFYGFFENFSLILRQFRAEGVRLCQGDDLRLFGEASAIFLEFAPDGLVSAGQVVLRAVDQVQKHRRAFDVAQKTVAEAVAFVRALDQAGDIGDYEVDFARPDDAEVRVKGGEGVVRDFGFCVRAGSQKGGFARVGQPDQSDIGDQFQAQPDRCLLARPAGGEFAGGLIGRSFVMGVAEAAVAALQKHNALPGFGEVREDGFLILVENDRADGHLDDAILAASACAVLAHAVLPGGSAEMLLIAEVDQGVEGIDNLDNYIAALAAVAAVGAAELHELFAVEADAAGAALTAFEIYFSLIQKFHGRLYPADNEKGEISFPSFVSDDFALKKDYSAACACASFAGRTFTMGLPPGPLEKSTWPSRRAKMV